MFTVSVVLYYDAVWVIVCTCITSNSSFALCIFSTQCLFMSNKDLPFLMSPIHCFLYSLTGMLKSPDIFVLCLKRELRWAIEGLCPGILTFFSWFLEVFQVEWNDEEVREWIKRLLTVLSLVLWGTNGNSVPTVSQALALQISVLSGPFFKCFFPCPYKTVRMKPSWKQQLVSQEPGKMGSMGGKGSWVYGV